MSNRKEINHYVKLIEVIDTFIKLEPTTQDELTRKITELYSRITKSSNDNDLIHSGKEFWNTINTIDEKLKFDLNNEANEFITPYHVKGNATECMITFYYRTSKINPESTTRKLIENTYFNQIIKEAYKNH